MSSSPVFQVVVAGFSVREIFRRNGAEAAFDDLLLRHNLTSEDRGWVLTDLIRDRFGISRTSSGQFMTPMELSDNRRIASRMFTDTVAYWMPYLPKPHQCILGVATIQTEKFLVNASKIQDRGYMGRLVETTNHINRSVVELIQMGYPYVVVQGLKPQPAVVARFVIEIGTHNPEYDYYTSA